MQYITSKVMQSHTCTHSLTHTHTDAHTHTYSERKRIFKAEFKINANF